MMDLLIKAVKLLIDLQKLMNVLKWYIKRMQVCLLPAMQDWRRQLANMFYLLMATIMLKKNMPNIFLISLIIVMRIWQLVLIILPPTQIGKPEKTI